MNNHDMLGQAVSGDVLPWLWLTLAEVPRQPQWPGINPDEGTFHGTVRCQRQIKQPDRNVDAGQGML